ncbi:hypothetical protein ACNTMW_28265 [Planosporangium sp. 12N6]|uniref:hypothetical protein n=1 Tax=Planosporangium spinosum TaxID=3402278 RepID=UPI003CE6B93F
MPRIRRRLVLKRTYLFAILGIFALIAAPVLFATSGPPGMSDQERWTWLGVAASGFGIMITSIVVGRRRNK